MKQWNYSLVSRSFIFGRLGRFITFSAQFSLLALASATFSCKRAQNCAPVTRDYAVVQFVDSLGAAKDEVFTITSITSDTALVENTVTSSVFNLPLDPFEDNVMFVFANADGENWITVGYRNAVFINSEDCGPEFVFSDLTIWGTSYDSVRLIDNRLLNGIEINLRVYDF